ncbi:major facilitator superfamily domain-containing protein [Dactylonectria macrodidyma]|uniref:Major facilitator superfamily domain-containing protein n=1 Tax=Dactylonectria macrodidyma TaxID=307937 RepID=A0A9P9EU76_9HYPO|nr:major facilitator superfamily domain-containing protein [Dactylonectria macrodidyma]
MAGIKWPREGKPPVLLKLRSSAGLIVTCCSFAVFTDIFLYAVIVPIMPFSLETQVGLKADRVQYWVSISLAVYGAALLVFSPIWGYIADRIGNRRLPMLVGLIMLTAATVILCMSKTLAMFMVGRALQGISASLTWTVGLALVIDSVDSKDVGKATGWVGMSTSVGVLSAPLLGGVVYAKGGYYQVFSMCFGLLAVDIALRLAIIEVKEAKRWLDQAANLPSSDPEGNPKGTADGSAGNNTGGTLTTQLPEKLTEDIQPEAPITPKDASRTSQSPLGTLIKLLRQPRLLSALWGTVVQAIIMTSFDSTLPLFVSDTFGWNSVGGGLIFLPIILPSFGSPVIGALGDRFGAKWLATFGFFFATPFLICLRFVSEDSMAHKALLCGLLVGIGIAMAFVFGPLMAEINWAVQGDEQSSDEVPVAQAYGLYNVAFSAGTMLGPIMGGLIRDSSGFPTVGWALAIVSFLSAIPQLIWTGGPLGVKFQTGLRS